MKPKVLLLFSGGFDSTVLLQELHHEGYDVNLLFMDYGQKGFDIEYKHFCYWRDKYDLVSFVRKVPAFEISPSHSMKGNFENEYTDSTEYVELRNLVFFSIASSLAQSLNIGTIATALIWGSDFPDTKPEFVKSFDAMLYSLSGITLYAPYMFMTKMELADSFFEELYGDIYSVVYNSITCNVPEGGKPCGKCGGCEEIEEIKEKYEKYL